MMILVNDKFISDCFSDLWTINLTFVSILLSIITLLYSFIFSKRSELVELSEQLKYTGNINMIIRRNIILKYIRRLIKINQDCFYLLLCSAILTCSSWVGMRLLTAEVKKIALFAVAGLTLSFLICFICLLGKIYKQYMKDVDL